MFPELNSILDLKKYHGGQIKCETIDEIECQKSRYPIVSFEVGSEKEDAPCFGLFGGVHGIEKVGTEVVTSFLATLFEELKWNKNLQNLFKNVRLVSIPLVNPGGMSQNSRSNPNGVDIMRNAPIESEIPSNFFISGHRLSEKLPWYRGEEGKLERETDILIEFIKKHFFKSSFAMSIDIHSGFGLRDRLWFPWAKSNDIFPFYDNVRKITETFNQTLPHNIYKIEQQSDSYTTHGDVWDYLVEEFMSQSKKIFIPWTLEIGSWVWLKKNPIQLFDSGGIFNPMKSHRFSRTMRRHKLLLNYLLNATSNSKAWV